MSPNTNNDATTNRRRRTLGIVLWTLAVILTLASAVYQRLTGPTHPLRVKTEVAGQAYKAKLLRSGTVGVDAKIAIPDPGSGVVGVLKYKRFKTDDPFTTAPMSLVDGKLTGYLPTQPMAGKLEYTVDLVDGGNPITIPEGDPVVIRYKGAVPAAVLVPHIFLMFFAMLIGMRTLLEAIAMQNGVRWMVWATTLLVFGGGLILGPAVQLYAFGEAWTGWPNGMDLTDNKTLVSFIFWLAAIWGVGLRGTLLKRGRILAVVAALVMIAIYLIPHSMFGSELDYEKVDAGSNPEESIGQG